MSQIGASELGLLLSQAGEFGFVLFSMATAAALITPEAASLFSAVVTLSMATTPFLMRLTEWLERREDGIGLYVAPAHVGGALRRTLVDRHRSVVMTSATLGVAGTMTFTMDRLGVSDGGEQAIRVDARYEPPCGEEQSGAEESQDRPGVGAIGAGFHIATPR